MAPVRVIQGKFDGSVKTIKYEILQIVCHTDSDWDDVLLR